MSEWGDLNSRTLYEDYDAFGRPGTIKPPDDPINHAVGLSYTGVSRVERTVAIEQGGGETDVTTAETYDRFGRLHQVEEPIGGATVFTYGYDEQGRLVSVNAGVQSRTFDYDGRGFLLTETHPEISPVDYTDYDARGHAGEMTDPGRTLKYTYDAAERLFDVTDAVGVALKQFRYDGATTHGGGKLHTAKRFNRLDLPQDGNPSTVTVVVTETYDYDAIGGRVSSVLTTNTLNSEMEFLTSQTYDAFGRVEDLVYPICQESAECPTDSLTVRNTYQAGYLVGVGTPSDPDFFATIDYHPNGLWSTINHANGVTTTQVNDPDSMRRPNQIFVSGTAAEEGTPEPLDTGLYAYDGSGNIKSMGSDTFAYDDLSRLVDAVVHTWHQDFLYDDYGNTTRIRTTEPGQGQSTQNITVTPATNRLTNSTYDGSGNMTKFNNSNPAWTQTYDLLNMATTRNDPPGGEPQWAAIYTANDERLATWDMSSGELEQHWTLRSAAGRVLRDFRFATATPGDLIFADGFESSPS